MRLRLSRFMTALLRHAAPKYGLSLDPEGWVSLGKLLGVMRSRYPWLRAEHLLAVAHTDPKGRFEVREGLIRARYGHTLHVELSYPEDLEIKLLYHGTTSSKVGTILREGLKPMRRRMVHLSPTLEDALINALRWRRTPSIIVVDADKLRSRGVKVFRASHRVYLAKHVPPSCIVKVIKDIKPYTFERSSLS